MSKLDQMGRMGLMGLALAVRITVQCSLLGPASDVGLFLFFGALGLDSHRPG